MIIIISGIMNDVNGIVSSSPVIETFLLDEDNVSDLVSEDGVTELISEE